MIYKGFEIRAEVRTLSQWRLSEAGELLDAYDMDDEELEGFYCVMGNEARENLPTVADVKRQIDAFVTS